MRSGGRVRVRARARARVRLRLRLWVRVRAEARAMIREYQITNAHLAFSDKSIYLRTSRRWTAASDQSSVLEDWRTGELVDWRCL